MKRLSIILIASLLFSATYVTTQSGKWSNVATWGGGGYPSADGDIAIIRAAHSCTLDVDLSSLSTGLGGIQDTGFLYIQSNTGLKMQGNITGSGIFRVGCETDSVTGVKILINGNYSNQIADAQYWGKNRTGEIIGYLDGAQTSGNNKVKLDRDMDIRVGDVITIACGSVTGNVSTESSNWGNTLFEVTAYSTTTDTVTLDKNLGSNRNSGDVVAVVTREIQIRQLSKSGSNPRYNNTNNSQYYQNVWFNGSGVEATGGFSNTFVSCAITNGGGLTKDGGKNRFSGTMTACNNSDATIIVGFCHVFLDTIISVNNTAGVTTTGGNHVIASVVVAWNNCSVGVAYGGFGHLLSGSFTAINNLAGGIIREGTNHTLSGTFNTSGNSMTGIANNCYSCVLSGTFTSSEATQIYYGNNYISGTFNSNKNISYRSAEFKHPWIQTIWFNYDGTRRHRIFAYAGYISTESDLSAIVFNLENDSVPLIYDIPIYPYNNKIVFTQRVKKSASMDSLPYIALIDPNSDPLKTTDGVAIAADTMTNSIDTWETLTITGTVTAYKRYIIRLWARGSTGTVSWAGRDIAEMLVSDPWHGYWTK